MDDFDVELPISQEPSVWGKIKFEVLTMPVSLQANPQRKMELVRKIQSYFWPFKYYLSGDISVCIEWHGNEPRRYDTPHDPDVDNVIKPIIDGLSGPGSIIFDDCQVQSVMCSWIDTWGRDMLWVSIEYSPDDFYLKSGLFFIKYDKNLCMPYNKHSDPKRLVRIIHTNNDRLQKKLIAPTAQEKENAEKDMPIQRMYHFSRVNAFEVVDYADAEKYIYSKTVMP